MLQRVAPFASRSGLLLPFLLGDTALLLLVETVRSG